MYKIIIPAICLSMMVACGGSSDNSIEAKEGVVASNLSAKPKTAEEIKQLEQEAKERQEKYESTLTTFEFDKVYHDFGNVGPDSENTTEFKITNTGKVPLILDDVSASCGCTTPQWPKEPIPPGQSDVIAVTFSPKPNQKEEIKKTVTVTANTTEKVHIVDIRAFVTQ
jgi:hypothetical protein